MNDYSAGAQIRKAVVDIKKNINKQIENRAFLAVQELKNSELRVLRGQRAGRRYAVPGTGRVTKKGKKIRVRHYTASAPGEAPAVRTGVFRNSWMPKVVDNADGSVTLRLSTAENSKGYPGYLEYGTPKMAPRPYVKRIQEGSVGGIKAVLNEPYY